MKRYVLDFLLRHKGKVFSLIVAVLGAVAACAKLSS